MTCHLSIFFAFFPFFSSPLYCVDSRCGVVCGCIVIFVLVGVGVRVVPSRLFSFFSSLPVSPCPGGLAGCPAQITLASNTYLFCTAYLILLFSFPSFFFCKLHLNCAPLYVPYSLLYCNRSASCRWAALKGSNPASEPRAHPCRLAARELKPAPLSGLGKPKSMLQPLQADKDFPSCAEPPRERDTTTTAASIVFSRNLNNLTLQHLLFSFL